MLQKMTPPIKDLLPRLTPILKNRQEKVQENCIDLVGRIADRCASSLFQQILISSFRWCLNLCLAQRRRPHCTRSQIVSVTTRLQ